MPRNRSLPPHLEIRRSGYYWRRRLPRSLRDRGATASGDPGKGTCTPSKKSFLCFSLRTHVPASAKMLARRLTEMSDQVFAADAETMMAIAPETQIWMLESLARFEIEAFERERAVAGPRSPEAAALGLRREEALQDTLRQALWLGNREVAGQPLRHVAAHLGIELDDADEDWNALAYEATKVLLDVSQERGRRQQGLYDQPTVFFRRAIATSGSRAAEPTAPSTNAAVASASFATSAPVPVSAAPAPAAFVTAQPVTAPRPTEPVSIDVSHQETAGQPVVASEHATSTLHASTFLTQFIVPAGLDLPAGYDEERWQEARIAARPPRLLIDRSLLSEKTQAALAKQRGITLVEAIELLFELLSWGYKADFKKHQKRKPIPAHLKGATVEERLTEDQRGKYRLALKFWPAVLGDIPVDEISVEDVNDAMVITDFCSALHPSARPAPVRDDRRLPPPLNDLSAFESNGAPSSSLEALVAMRNAVAHGDARRIIPVNSGTRLRGYTLLCRPAQNAPLKWEVDLRLDARGMASIADKLAQKICAAVIAPECSATNLMRRARQSG